MRIVEYIFYLSAGVLLLLGGGCAHVNRGTPVPQELVSAARVPGYNHIRFSIDSSEHYLMREFGTAVKRAQKTKGVANLLAISGGGADGAFGAGILCGWTKHGDRPVFDVITAVSTGALLAPFAFLGEEYDDELKTAYTTLSDKDVFKKRSKFRMLESDSIAKTTPLYETISHHIDDKLLAAVAREHRRGRELFIMTTNLDSQRPIVWDMGEIAESGQPDALDLFRRIMVASASIPIMFPPQYINVEADSKSYTEMHVDGGVMGQVFLHLPPVSSTYTAPSNSQVNVYVIHNARVMPHYTSMRPKIFPILARTISTLVLTQGIGDLYEIYEQSKDRGATFNLAYIRDDHRHDPHHIFVPEKMKALFNKAYDEASKGYAWEHKPPKTM